MADQKTIIEDASPRATNEQAGAKQVTVSEKYTIEIPEEVREAISVEPGQEVVLIPMKGRIIMVPLMPLEEVARTTSRHGYKPTSRLGQTMNVVDSSGWIEYLSRGRNFDAFIEPIYNSDELLVPSVVISEVFRRIHRMFNEEEAYNAISRMLVNTVVNLDTNIAVLTGELSIEHRLALADSIIYATARSYSATLWTQDSDFEGLEDVRYIPHWSRTQE